MTPSIITAASINAINALVASLYAGTRGARIRPIDPVSGAGAWPVVDGQLVASAGGQVHHLPIDAHDLLALTRVRRLTFRGYRGGGSNWTATLLAVSISTNTPITLSTINVTAADSWQTCDTGALSSTAGSLGTYVLRLTSAQAGDRFARGRITLDAA